jgi:peptidoglycan/xylan/chitin deacetylase (PgdA/CDA1 family)
VNARADWVLETLLSACAPAQAPVTYPSAALPASQAAWQYFDRGEPKPPRLGEGGMLDFGDGVQDIIASAFWHLSRWEERPGSPRDRHGRFAAGSALADPERPAVDALLERFQQATGRARCDRFRVVLTHDIDTPRRWTSARTVVAAGARMKAAAFGRRRADLAGEARGLAALPLGVLRGRDPNWSFQRMHEIEQARGGRSTHFLLAGHHHPADGDGAAYGAVRARLVDLIAAQGDEVGLHPSYTTSDHPERLHRERDALQALTGRPLRSARFPFLRHDPHTSLAALERLGFALDSSHGYADRPGLRAGFSFPYRPYDLAADRPLDLVELPLALMDATLSDSRYLGLDAEAGYLRSVELLERVASIGGTVAILWHNDRFADHYARGWDRCYERILDWVVARGGELCACEDVLGKTTRPG